MYLDPECTRVYLLSMCIMYMQLQGVCSESADVTSLYNVICGPICAHFQVNSE